jgi:hypothetical protein
MAADGTVVNLGWEPQWMFEKRTGSAQDWIMLTTCEGCYRVSQDASFANTTEAEGAFCK